MQNLFPSVWVEKANQKLKAGICDGCVEQCLTLQAEPQRRAYAEAAEKGEIFVGVAEGLQNRELYGEFVVAQVKVRLRLSFPPNSQIEDLSSLG